MARYKLSRLALRDLSEIWNYSVDTWSEAQADKYYLEILHACELIANDPALGKSFADIAPALLGYKTGKHIIFYQINSGAVVDIIRILHERMDLKNRL